MADKKISQLTAASTPLAGTEVLPIVQGGSTVKATVNNVLAPLQVTTTRVGINTAPNFSFHVLGVGEFGGALFQSNAGGATSFTIQQGVTGVSNSGVTIRNADSAYDWLRFTATGGDVTVQTGNLVVGTAGKGIDFSANTHAAGMTSELLNDYEEGTFTPVLSSSGTPPTIASYLTQYGSYTKIGNRVLATVSIRANLTNAGTGYPIVTGLPYAPNSNCFNGPTFGLAALLTIGAVQQNFISGTSVLLVNCLYNITTDYLCFSIMYEV